MLSRITTARVLLTLGVFEFFGPIFRDAGASHLLNPEWAGHARFHLAWMLVFMAGSGLANLVLIWKRDANLYIPLAWQACNIAGFWGAVALASSYGGAVVMPDQHMTVLGLNENVFVFVVLSVLLAVTGAAVHRAR